MNLRRRAFTLVELLTVMSIIAILTAIFSPVIRAAKASVNQSVAVGSLKQLSMATSMYLADADDVYPIAMYVGGDHVLQTWFGRQKVDRSFDGSQGLLSIYIKGKITPDPTHIAKPWAGDMTGFGYNWGYLGSDFYLPTGTHPFPNCEHAASSGELTSPSSTIIYATSAFYNAKWLDGGDRVVYDFGFIDPPKMWSGNATVDFRHRDRRTVNELAKSTSSQGWAVVAFADGNVRPMKATQMRDPHFYRNQDDVPENHSDRLDSRSNLSQNNPLLPAD